jgi:8-hydroxy-5-deazaflavin:NADPH oxidoreductase
VTHRRTVLTTLGATLALTAVTDRAKGQSTRDTRMKEAIAILGTGRMGKALGKGWATVGHPIIYGSRNPDDARVQSLVNETGSQASVLSPRDAASKATFVVFALPWNAVPDMLPTLGALADKIVLDPMNALKIVDGYPQPLPDLHTSVGEQLQAWLPKARVVKAFNTPAVRSIVDPKRFDGPISVALAGADAEAKSRVATLVSELGLEPADTGPLIAARYLEGMMRLSLGYLFHSKMQKSFEFYLRPVPR